MCVKSAQRIGKRLTFKDESALAEQLAMACAKAWARLRALIARYGALGFVSGPVLSCFHGADHGTVVRNYVVAHEVAHLAHMNHGPKFWATVEQLYPGYTAQRLWLRQRGNATAIVTPPEDEGPFSTTANSIDPKPIADKVAHVDPVPP